MKIFTTQNTNTSGVKSICSEGRFATLWVIDKALSLIIIGILCILVGIVQVRAQPQIGYRIAYSKPNVRYVSQIYTAKPNGTDEKQVTNSDDHSWDPIYSPDGTRIAFSRRLGFDSKIYTINPDGTGERLVTQSFGDFRNPTWSPDSTRLAYSNHRGNIFTINADGTNERSITDNRIDGVDCDEPGVTITCGDPTWARDGSNRIAFTINRGDAYQSDIYSMNADGTGLRRITSDFGNEYSPAWSRNGFIAFTSDRDKSPIEIYNTEIYRMDANGAGWVRVTRSPYADDKPSWSPANDRIAFESDNNNGTRIYTINPFGFDTYTEEQLVGRGRAPSWGAVTVPLEPPSPCSPAPLLDPATQHIATEGGDGEFKIIAEEDCKRTAVSNVWWISITSTGIFYSSDTAYEGFSYSVQRNYDSPARTGTITVNGQKFTVNQSPSSCTYSLNPTTRDVAGTTGADSFRIITETGCPWVAFSNDSWITVTSERNGSGERTISYSFQANTGSPRSGTIKAGWQTFTLNQQSGSPTCTYSLSPPTRNIAGAVGAGSFTVTTGQGCAWTAVSNDSWITVTSGGSGSSSGTVSYSVQANTNPTSRTGTIKVGNQTFTIIQQAAPCTNALTPSMREFSGSGGSSNFTVSSASNCAWTAVSNDLWITITSGGSGSSSGTVGYSVQANTNPTSRTGTITVGNQTFTVQQATSCTYVLSPIAENFAYTSGIGNFTVTTPSGCSWTAVSNDSWIKVIGTGSGSGSAVIYYTVEANNGSDSRVGTITVANKTFTINQEVSPTTQQIAKLLAADGRGGDFFGYSIAISGNTAIIGAYEATGTKYKQGVAYIFVKNGTIWTQQAKLVAADAETNDGFGFDVAISGDTVVVGSRGDDINSNLDQGSAYVFIRNGTSWTQQTKLVAAVGATYDQFGKSVAINGNTAIVSTHNSAYVFIRNGTSWTQQAKLVAADGAAEDGFGTSVAISGDTAVVSSGYDDINSNLDQGSAYIFIRNGTTWTQQAKLVAADGAANDLFGYSVAISGDTVVVGSFQDDIINSKPNQGSAYVFIRNGTTWTQQVKLVAADGAVNDQFGTSVAISEDAIVVGAWQDTVNTNSGQGSAYIFIRNGITWMQQSKIVAADGASSNHFGISVGISGNTVIVGAYGVSIQSYGQGAAYMFSMPPRSLRALFDYDGDGKSDISVYRPSNGAWYLNQSASGFTGVQFGVSEDKLVPADYDGDGKTDLAVYRNGTWYLNRSSAGFTGIAFGDSNDVPQPADFDGDGKAEITVYRPSNGTWYVFNLATNQFSAYQFGASTDKPVVGDYDGDNKADYAVYRPSNGTWYMQRSAAGFTGVQFGDSNDKPVPADYDGDGKTDVAVFRPSNGTWYLQRSQSGFTGIQFGIATDLPVAADYDGDGKADVAVYRSGVWYLNRTTAGFTGVQFGAATDKPAPNAFVP